MHESGVTFVSDLAKDGFWLFGSGTFARDVAVVCRRNGLNLLGVLDHLNSEFLNFRDLDIPTYELSEVRDFSSAPIYLAICNPYVNIRRLDDKIRLFATSSDIRSPVLLCRFLSSVGLSIQNYWLTTDLSLYDNSQLEISHFESVLEDKQSRELLRSILNYRVNGNISDLPAQSPISEQYLPVGLNTPPSRLNMLEMGSCGGENLISFIRSGLAIEQSIAFEPDLVNYQQLVQLIEHHELSHVIPLPLAAWDSTVQLRFSASGSSNSSVNPNGDSMIQAVAVDEFIPKDIKVNYIKMDIEGAEPHALMGSMKVIERNVPHLAICVYHKPEQLWEIGLWILANFPQKYRFYLRSYAEQTFETVLYCIPR
jgi:FkbM family methyltransferase